LVGGYWLEIISWWLWKIKNRFIWVNGELQLWR